MTRWIDEVVGRVGYCFFRIGLIGIACRIWVWNETRIENRSGELLTFGDEESAR